MPTFLKSALLAFGAISLGSPALAEESPGDWQLRASAYAFLPDVSGKPSFPGADTITVDAGKLLNHTDAAFMGLMEVQHRQVGAFADLIYIDLGNSRDGATELSVGGGTPLPPGVAADLSLDIKAVILTLGGNYRFHDTPSASLDVFAGGRMLNLKSRLTYAFNVGFGPFQGPFQQGDLSARGTNWDAIVGTKGRLGFGKQHEWFVQYYADVGAGESDLTWQAFVGAGRRFGRFDVIAGWRHIDYNLSGPRIDKLKFDGPLVGASLNF